MRKIILIFIILMLMIGCTKKQDIVKQTSITLSTEKEINYKEQIKELLVEKLWDFDDTMSYSIVNIPMGVQGTYYEEIIKKSEDSGFELTEYLGNDAIEVKCTLKYPTGDIAGDAHFLFAHDTIVGAYYLVGNYIYSLNEKEVFKKKIEWQNIENTRINYSFSEIQVDADKDLIYYGKYNNNQTYLFSYSDSKLKMKYLDKDSLILSREISLDNLKLIDMFFKDIDNDNNSELGLLVTNNIDDSKISKLIIYDIENGLHERYSMDFALQMTSIDFDGNNLIVTSQNSIEMYRFEKDKIVKSYLNNKLGGKIRVDNIDGGNTQYYILISSDKKDIFVFENVKNDVEEIWRTYNVDEKYTSNVQIGDLNNDGVKEIYIEDIWGNIRKVILDKNGFSETDELINGHKYFIGDFNNDKKYEYFDSFTVQKTKEYCTIYKY